VSGFSAPPPAVVDHRLTLTAYHEAGHAVMAQLCGQQVTEVEIVGDDELSGSVRSLRFVEEDPALVDPNLPTAPVERRLLCTVAGMVAEAMVSGRDGWDDSSEDLDTAVRLALQVVGNCERVMPYLEQVRDHAEDVLRHSWPAVEALASALVAKRRLTGDEVRRLLDA
jgi:ATP-dependent Zn protease